MTSAKQTGETKPRKFRFSYRLFVREEGERNAVQFTTKLMECEPCDLKDVEESIKDAAERLVDSIR